MRRSISTTISVILLRRKCSLLSAMHSHCLDENFQWQNFAWISFFFCFDAINLSLCYVVDQALTSNVCKIA